MNDLPEFLAPPPEKEALTLALEALAFDPLDADADLLAKGGYDNTPPLRVFLLLDASVSPDISVCAQAFDEQARCLFDGAAFEELSEVGPWLIELKRHGDAWDWFVEDGWSNNWGIIVHTRLTLAKIKTHFKKFTKVQDEDGQTYFFKFYRPEHLNTYLPAFDEEQTTRFMKGIESLLAESQQEPTHIVRHMMPKEGTLVTQVEDLIATGMPLRVVPPSPEEVQAFLASVQKSS